MSGLILLLCTLKLKISGIKTEKAIKYLNYKGCSKDIFTQRLCRPDKAYLTYYKARSLQRQLSKDFEAALQGRNEVA